MDHSSAHTLDDKDKSTDNEMDQNSRRECLDKRSMQE